MFRIAAVAFSALALVVPARCDRETQDRCAPYDALIAGYPDWDVARMQRYMHRESECHPDVVSRTNDWGLLQIHVNRATFTTIMRWGLPSLADACGIAAKEELLDPDTNVRCAHSLWEAWSYRPWQ